MREHKTSYLVRAYKSGMAPVAIGLLFATAYLLLSGDLTNWKSVCWAAVVTLIVWRTKFPLILLIAAGGVLGVLGAFT